MIAELGRDGGEELEIDLGVEPGGCAGVAARAISSANPAGELINKLRQPFGPALIACWVLRGMT